ncbi:MAG TPA: rhodanese-like domain-containing protein [Saprospiraceae bacterium]|nr:rhodanese-like domain-containing protein [Saprospiraceae bacterium]HRO09497.1 rhodanese-like domain-containing protein [Saprospiraceae bacterium]HRO73944.1 rhodanese-like domain-containing protein [Saprospiraceae bacterium]HRP42775.1 rhodanese-like domain-containing protein [Saprospiraceae bacterium]
MSEDITVTELKQKMDNGDSFIFLDVREPFEYEEFNLNARLIPLGNIEASIADLEQYKDDEIIIHCRSGARSGTAKMILLQHGFTNVRNVLGGVLDWVNTFGK